MARAEVGRPKLTALLPLVLMATLAVEPGAAAQVSPDATVPSPATNDYASDVLAGISNQGRTRQQPYVTAGDRTGWITNRNWVIATPMETGIAPRARAIRLLDKIRRENTGEYGPYLSAVERRAMMTISTGVQAVAEGKYGRTNEARWYVDRIAQTFNRVSPGSISEMMPDYGCFTIAWTSYGIVLPLIEHVFGIRADAPNKTIVFEPHLPAGWENISIEDLPVGANLISFSRARTGKGIVYDIEAGESGWKLILREKSSPGVRYFLNGRPINPALSEIHMEGNKNRVLITSEHLH